MKEIYMNIMQMIQYVCNISTKSERKIIEKEMSESDEFMDQMVLLYEIMHHPDLKEWKLWEPAYSYRLTSDIIDSSKQNIQKATKTFYNWIKNQSPPEWAVSVFNPVESMQLTPVPIRVRKRRKDLQSSHSFVELQTDIDNFKVNIYVEQSGKKMALIKIQVHQQEKLTRYVRIFLKKEDISCPWARLQSDQYVLFEDIPYGIFQIILKKDSKTIGEYRFSIDTNGVKPDV